MRRSKYLGLAISAVLAGGLAHAETPSAAKSKTQGTGGTLEEIIVTAQKREERLQDVPVAVAALTGDAITNRGVRTADELQMTIPALSWQKNLNAQPYIRGVGSRITTAGNQSSVPIFVDGVLQISPLQGNFNLAEVERVEVL